MNTNCDTCIHREVCSLKSVYVEAVETIRNAHISWPGPGNRITMRDISRIEFIKILDPECMHYICDPKETSAMRGE